MKGQPLKKTIYVAMSGGVDSSVAAALIKKQGFRVVGVFMKPWQPWPGLCMWQGDREDAMRAAAKLEIPLLTWDFSKEYKKEVGDYMIREYRSGRTPNPDVMCNKEIKFGLFLKKALKEGADLIATGHYVRIKSRRRGPATAHPQGAPKSAPWGSPSRVTPFGYNLYTAVDKNKDQSYFLWTLKQEQLKHCLFPIGDFTKPEVRKLAKKFGLPNHDKKDSQGVCFIGPLDMKNFLTRYIKNKKGNIMDKKGNIIGEHDGIFYYTIGQRHGLDIKNGQGPYYVTGKDIKKNIVYVGDEEDLYSLEAKVKHINWVNPVRSLARAKGASPEDLGEATSNGTAKIEVKIRYRSRSEKAVMFGGRTSKHSRLRFGKPIRAITSGQSAVFYKGSEMLGGGIIE